jgi:hypothetical protein
VTFQLEENRFSNLPVEKSLGYPDMDDCTNDYSKEKTLVRIGNLQISKLRLG